MIKFKNIKQQSCNCEEETETITGGIELNERWSSESLTYFGPDNRSILLSGEIDTEVANAMFSQLVSLDKDDQEEPIYFYINTNGGCVASSLMIYDCIRTIHAPVIGVVIAHCQSAGLPILQGCDYRASLPNATYYYHEPISMALLSSQEDAAISQNQYDMYFAKIKEIMMTRSRMSKTTWKKCFEGRVNYPFNAMEALRHRLIDEIIPYTKQKPIKIVRDDG